MRTLSFEEVESVAGGVDWGQFGVGLALVATGFALSTATGLGGVPLTYLGAATIGEAFVVGTVLTTSIAGGAIMGNATTQPSPGKDKQGGS